MKQVTILAPDCPVNVNSIGGAYDILCRANEHWKSTYDILRIEVHIAGPVPQLKSHNNLLAVYPQPLDDMPHPDLLIIPAILDDYKQAIAQNEQLIRQIKTMYENGTEIACMCSGSFLLAATGLLNGKRCSVHWNKEADFKRMFPEVLVTEDKIITAESGIYTSGGAYSFLNLVIYLVEQIFDRDTAIMCAKIFQIDIERNTQSPFTIFHGQKDHGDELINKAQDYLEQHLDSKISFEKLSTELAVSRRNFDRRFIKATGNTPTEYLQRIKMEAAKRELEKGYKTVFEVMTDVGYADDKAFRDVFRKVTGMSPLGYKNKYNKQYLR